MLTSLTTITHVSHALELRNVHCPATCSNYHWEKMAHLPSPGRSESKAKVWELKQRLHKCWDLSLDWSLYPHHITTGCMQIGKAIDMPPDAILSGLLLLVSFFMSHCVVKVPGTVWVEPAILWIAIAMPTGSGKTPLFTFLTNILHDVRKKLKLTSVHPPWLLDEASFEKMGELMSTNYCKLLGMYDELSTFLSQINVYRGKGLTDSHDLSTFLSLYTGKSWTRATVSGDANFHMERTALTVGGFTQPSVAKALIELPASIEKGLTQRFLWICPKPSFATFDSLELIDNRFTEYLVDRLACLWRASENEVLILSIPNNCEEFKKYYDNLQEKISQLSVLDELLSASTQVRPSTESLAAYCLLLPGKQLHLSALLAAKKFRGRGNKVAALASFQELEEAGLGNLKVQESRRGTSAVYTFTKNAVDDDLDDLMTKLARYGVTISQYQRAMQMEEIKGQDASGKRTGGATPPPVRRSPRKQQEGGQ